MSRCHDNSPDASLVLRREETGHVSSSARTETLVERAVRACARLTDIVAFARMLALEGRVYRGGLLVLCPWHVEKRPSCSVRLYRNGIGAYCFACGRGGTALSVIAAVRGLRIHGSDFARVVDIAEELAGMAPQLLRRRQTAVRHLPPPSAEGLAELWHRSTPVTGSSTAMDWCVTRGLDPVTVEECDGVRAIPMSGALPGWARSRGGSWRDTGHLVITRTFTEMGALGGLRARIVHGGPGLPKELAPLGGSRGVLADDAARSILLGGPGKTMLTPVVIAEGVPDWLTWATVFSDANEEARAALGVFAGAWSVTIAARIPDLTHVLLRLHDDAAGHRYAEDIVATFGSRCVLEESDAGK